MVTERWVNRKEHQRKNAYYRNYAAAAFLLYAFRMSAVLSPIESEFATVEEADAYDRWFRAKIQASLDDPRPNIPHDQVMAEMRQLLEAKRPRHNAR